MRRFSIPFSVLSAVLAFVFSAPIFAAPAGHDAPAAQKEPPRAEEELSAAEKAAENAPEKTGDEAAKEDSAGGEGEENPDLAAEISGNVAEQIAATVNENSAEDLLNLATEVKLSAESVLDLTKVITYCIEAEKKGLSDESLEFCRQLKLSSQLERGLAMANMFMADNLSIHDLPRGWEAVRAMALDDLTAAVEGHPDLTLAQLAIGRLEMLPGGDNEKAKTALDAAVASAENADAGIRAEALKYRSMLESDNDAGMEYLDQAMKLSDDNPALLALWATRLLDENQGEKALEAIDKAIALDSENKDYKKSKAFILASLERYDEAEKLFDEATADTADDLMTKIEKGQFLVSIKKNAEAIALFTEMIDQFSAFPSLYYLRGAIYAQDKDYKKALKDINQALRIDPSFNEAIQLKGVIYLQQKKYGDAVRLFEMLRAKNPDDEQSVAQLAYALSQNDDYTGAIRRLNALLKKKPECIELLRSKGDIQLLYGQWEKAIQTYEQILALRPNDSGTLNNYAWLLATSPEDSVRNGKKALEMATKAAEKTNYKEAHILSTLGSAYAEIGQFDKAIEWSEKAVALGEKEQNERLDDLKKEKESYLKKEPWRETPEKNGKPAEEPVDEVEEPVEFF